MSVSLAMLVLDPPIDRLAALLELVRPVVSDVVIVVDDRTREGDVSAMSTWRDVTLVPFRWVDDFATARNAALPECRGDWILHLDPDELPSPAMLDFIAAIDGTEWPDREWEGLTYRAPWGFLFWTRTFVDGYAVPSDERDWHCRLFRNHPRDRWYKRVHEQVLLDGHPESDTRETPLLPKAPAGAYLIHSKADPPAKIALYRDLESAVAV